MPEPPDPDRRKRPSGALGDAFMVADLGFRFVVVCALGAGAGFWLDGRLGLLERFPAFTLVGFFLGLGAAFVALLTGLKTWERRKRAREDEEREG